MSNGYYLKNKRFLSEEQPSIDPLSVLLSIAIAVMILILVFVCLFQKCEIEGESMQPTLNKENSIYNDSVLLTRYKTKIKAGDIIVLVNDITDKPLVKRVIALEGETIKFMSDKGVVKLYKKNSNNDFIEVSEPYIKEKMFDANFEKTYFKMDVSYTVPKDSFIYLGDNRNNSQDSRHYGYGKIDDIVGKMVYIINPESLSSHLINLIFN